MAEEKIQEKRQPPIAKVKYLGVELSGWENKTDDGQIYFTCSLKRNYKDSKGEWQETGTLRERDLLAVSFCTQEMARKLADLHAK